MVPSPADVLSYWKRLLDKLRAHVFQTESLSSISWDVHAVVSVKGESRISCRERRSALWADGERKRVGQVVDAFFQNPAGFFTVNNLFCLYE